MDTKLAQYWNKFKSLFPQVDEEIGETTEPLRRVIITLDVVQIERFVYDPALPTGRGRRMKARTAMARA